LEKKLDEPGSDVTGSAGNTHYMYSSGAHSALSSYALKWEVQEEALLD